MTTTQPMHTPGPWGVDEDDICSIECRHLQDFDRKGCFKIVQVFGPNRKANARLIAAAPELLAAAIAFREHLVNAVVFKRNDDREKCCKLDAALLAAIRKAKGEV